MKKQVFIITLMLGTFGVFASSCSKSENQKDDSNTVVYIIELVPPVSL